MSCNRSLAQYFRPMYEAGDAMMALQQPRAGGDRPIVSGMFDFKEFWREPRTFAGHIGPFARSLREHGSTRDSIHGQVLRALWLGHERVGTPQIHLEATIAMKERVWAKTSSPDGRRSRYKPGD
jgi:hypothetical protein